MQSYTQEQVVKLFGLFVVEALITSLVTSMLVFSIMSPASSTEVTDVHFTIEALFEGFIGVSENIENQANPDLFVPLNSKVVITLIAGEAMLHNLVVDEFFPDLHASRVSTSESSGYPSQVTFSFIADKKGTFIYYCSIGGHYNTMHGNLIAGESEVDKPAPAKETTVDSIVKHPSDIPAPVGMRAPQHLEFTLVTQEVIAEIEDGTTLEYWTFNETVPGPLIRVMVGDTVTINLVNPAESYHPHSVDFHAVTDIGGGAHHTHAEPGETKSFTFIATHEGVFLYHCASPHVPTHISLGMYGAISVEPAEGLPEVDKEFYVGQSEIYTKWRMGTLGHQEFDSERLYNEQPTYVVFNGKAFGLTDPAFSLNATKDDNIRIFFAVGGPNIPSYFHIIGEVFDNVYHETVGTPNMINAETIIVGPGMALMIEMNVEKVGTFYLVDHALSRAFDKGAIGFLHVTEA